MQMCLFFSVYNSCKLSVGVLKRASCMSMGQLIRHFGPGRRISTSTGWKSMLSYDGLAPNVVQAFP